MAESESPSAVSLSPTKKILVLIVVGVLLLGAWRGGLLELFSDPDKLRNTIEGLGPLGYVAFVLAFGILQPLGIPMIVFVLGASYLWPRPLAFGLSLLGTMTSATLAFYFARSLAHGWVRARLPPRLARLDDRIASHAFGTVVLVRLIFWGNPLTHMFFGISRISFRSYFTASLIAYIPVLAVIVWASSYALDYLKNNPVNAWLPWVALVVGLAVAARFVAAAVKKRRDA